MSEQIDLADAAAVTGVLDAAEKPDTMAIKIDPAEVDAVEEELACCRQETIEARTMLPQIIARQAEARGAVAAAVGQWQRVTGSVGSFEDLIRDHLRSEQERRRQIAAGEVAPPRRSGGPSVVDRLAGGHGAAHGMQRDSWRRGSYSSRSRGRTVPKLPSER